VPYRIDVANPPADALDRLLRLGALDVESTPDGLAAILPDTVEPDTLTRALGVARASISPAVGRDADSVWVLDAGLVRVGRLVIAPAGVAAPPGALRLEDSGAFGTGRHPTTRLCLEALEQECDSARPASVLDVGTGSGVLALSALRLGVPRAVGVDVDEGALAVAARNAELNHLRARLELVPGGPDAVPGQWPLVLANVLAAPLQEMAPALVRRVGHHGRLVLSGVPQGVAEDVARVYRDRGMHLSRQQIREGWSMLVLQASW
jgi:ribosomal protein L11 methyltransferase